MGAYDGDGMAVHGCIWLRMGAYDALMATFDVKSANRSWLHMAAYGYTRFIRLHSWVHTWLHMTTHVHAWLHMVAYDHI